MKENKQSISPHSVYITNSVSSEQLKDYTKPISEDVIRLQEKIESIEKRLGVFMWASGILITILVAVLPWILSSKH